MYIATIFLLSSPKTFYFPFFYPLSQGHKKIPVYLWFLKCVMLFIVPYSGSGIIPRSSLSGAGAVGLVGALGIWKGRDNWVKGGANGVSLQAT